MKKTIALVLIILFGCNNPGKTGKEKSLSTDKSSFIQKQIEKDSILDTITSFKEFIESMPILSIPLKVNCDDDKYPNSDFDRNRIFGKKFRPAGSTIIGRLVTTNQYVALVYSYPADIALPFLETYTLSGVKIDSLQLFTYENCVEDFNESIETNSAFVITKDFEIQIIDSVFDTKTGNDNIILKIFKETSVANYKISDSGKIIK
jgi:hypothetical protein